MIYNFGETKTTNRFWFYFWLAAILCCLAFIWSHSLQPADVSGEKSTNIFLLIKSICSPSWLAESIVRKIAHFIEFAGLGLCVSAWMRTLRLGSVLWKYGFVFPAAFGATAACVDEFIQLFVDGRSSQFKDVCLDMCGVCFGILITAFFAFMFAKAARNNTR